MWQWQFESNPFGLPFAPVVLADDEDRVVGFNGVMAVRATDRGKDISVLWSCDFYLAEQWRGQGLGSVIKHELHRNSPLIMSFGISNQASQVLRHLGWVPYESVRSYRMLRRRKGIRSWLLSCLQWLNRLQSFFSAVPDISGMHINVRSTLPEHERVDSLWERSAPGYERAVQRDFTYLNWRYQQHPLGRYGFVCAWKDDQLAAILVTRFSRGTLRIVDYCGPARNQPIKRSLVNAAVRHWPHAAQVMSVTSDPAFGEAFLAEGFVQLRGRPRFYIYEPGVEDSAGLSTWFIMAGDSDGEFLQAASDFYTTEPLLGVPAEERKQC
ncbi:GNAT family N-acetyltransferase [Marinobacter orientalis]|uniref:GNAT family N-acetyltransferase n=1 Tax=Marinobacter orientalis TaxID=1928859 RepID=A0A7Y0RCM4_9GAMM|nr:GNAT family N-acetyltransferase [Marinobacter orientalis]NMT63780.1 GNAT family N-acetyltransferase [Marinobacter orientalis]TGX49889.1 N-acetyltransferase [Marinobacter orientalis]